MSKKLFIGNLSYNATEEELNDLFARFGEINSVKIVKDFESGKSKGFGFIEMANEAEANVAIQNLNGYEYKGRALKLSEAKENSNGNRRSSGGGGGFSRGGSSGGGGGSFSRGGNRNSSGGGGGRGRSSY